MSGELFAEVESKSTVITALPGILPPVIATSEAREKESNDKPLFTLTKSLFFAPISRQQEEKSKLWPGEQLQDQLPEIFSFLDKKEFAKVQRVSNSWRTLSKAFEASDSHQAATRFQALRKQLLSDSLAERLLRTSDLSPALLTSYCSEIFDVAIVLKAPSELPALPLAFVDPEEEESKPVTLDQYLINTRNAIRPFMERPDAILPLFYGDWKGETKDKTQRRLAVTGRDVKGAWYCVITKAKKAREHLKLWDAELEYFDAHKTSGYSALVDFLEHAIAFEGFLADIVLLQRIARLFTRNQHLLGNHIYLLTHALQGLFSSECKERLRLQKQFTVLALPIIKNHKQTARITSRTLIALADFYLPFQLLPVLIQDPAFADQFNALTNEQVTLLTRELTPPGQQTSTFASYLQWYVQHKIPIDVFIERLSKEDLFWLLADRQKNAILLQSPAFIHKLNDLELMEVMTTRLGFLDYIEVCLQESPALVARMTPEICLAVMKKVPSYKEFILAVPVLINRFNNQELFSLLKTIYGKDFLIFAQHCRECLDKLTQEQSIALVTKHSHLEGDEDKKACVLIKHQVLIRFFPSKLDRELLSLDNNLLWLDNAALHARLEAIYAALQQEQTQDKERKATQRMPQQQEEVQASLGVAKVLVSNPSQENPALKPYSLSENKRLIPSVLNNSEEATHSLENSSGFLIIGGGVLTLLGLYLLTSSLSAWISAQIFLGMPLTAVPYAFAGGILIAILLLVGVCRDLASRSIEVQSPAASEALGSSSLSHAVSMASSRVVLIATPNATASPAVTLRGV